MMAGRNYGMVRKSLLKENTRPEAEKERLEAQQCMGTGNMPPCCMGDSGMCPERMPDGRQSGQMSGSMTMGQRFDGMQSGRMSGVMPGRMPGMQSSGSEQARCMLRKQVDETSFAMDDAHLFLDTHPDDAAAFQYFKNMVAMRQNAVNAYERQFGPLMVEDAANGDTFNWVTEQWPWEGGC